MSQTIEMPKYRATRILHALKILEVVDSQDNDGWKILHFVDTRYAPVHVDGDFVVDQNPQDGDYYCMINKYPFCMDARDFEQGFNLEVD